LYPVAPLTAVHVKATWPFPGVTLRFVGALGTGTWGIALTWLEGDDSPPAFVAVTT
jgi:hypothetical protein